MRRLLVLLIICSAVSWAQWVKLNSGTDATLRGVKAAKKLIVKIGFKARLEAHDGLPQ